MPDPVIVVGGGPAGMVMALALHRAGVTAEVRDARERGAAGNDPRILALSHGSRLTLESLGVWREIAQAPIATIHVSQQDGLGRTLIRARDEGVPALGYVLVAGDLARALDAALTRAAIPVREHAPVAATATLAAPLVIRAEGAIEATAARGRGYGQHAIVCNASLSAGHGARAWERFTPQGPVAVLPLDAGRRVAVVLTCDAAAAADIAAMDDAAFLAHLQARFGRRVEFVAAEPRHVFPLGLRWREHPVGEREVWIGNAAQTLHPVAGQGFNLALRDIHELARRVADVPDPGAPAVLAAYAAARRADRRATIGVTDGLVRGFGIAHPLARHARGAGLLALDMLSPARSFLARRMMFGARGW